ncbi:hypothetical protein [Butyrivibrio sp. INlla16]|uniref:hypothetical protein n=1 Tax=Butyrivibrio sp. INlla16 TaxID=1520807 RepID=UPI00088DC830|nr:hypothetical protein [Butyrivibrio sp. INlla16]SDB06566.1 hypothetical protein SAMN02910263_00241 [Butyrivibrio sp. INlla16]
MDSKKIVALREWGADTESAIKRMVGDEKFYLNLVDSFLSNNDWRDLCLKIEKKQYKDAFVISHRIKGSCADLSLTPLFTAMCELTDDLRNDEIRPTLETNLKIAGKLRDRLIETLN